MLNSRPGRSSSRRLVQRITPSPPPSARSGRLLAGSIKPNESTRTPALPTCKVGAPPGLPPGATRPAPQLGGIRGVGVPPELRRRIPGASRAAAGAAEVAEHERVALQGAQQKLFDARRKLLSSVTALRSLMGAARQ